ncbi:hypothetical protein Q5P01_011005 [Channa striata]|uniref:Uncharacterized protein n=1 Tax=Channa striata TaxID=64152 RepID=A0AA88SNQ5_CHASR|nr:hypothetical protein Q5P01_011005 [Channa striata]
MENKNPVSLGQTIKNGSAGSAGHKEICQDSVTVSLLSGHATHKPESKVETHLHRQEPCNDRDRPYESSNTPHYDDQSHETSHKCRLDGLSVQPPTFVPLQLVEAEIHTAESHLVPGLLAPRPALPEPPVPGHPAAHAQPQLLLTPGDPEVLDDDRRDGPVERRGEKSPSVVVGGVDEHVTLEAEAAVPVGHQRRGQESLDAHVALGQSLQGGGVGRGGVALLHGPLGEAHVHLQVGQEPGGRVDGRQEKVLVAPALTSLEKSGHCGQSQQQSRRVVQHGTGRVSPVRMARWRSAGDGRRCQPPAVVRNAARDGDIRFPARLV